MEHQDHVAVMDPNGDFDPRINLNAFDYSKYIHKWVDTVTMISDNTFGFYQEDDPWNDHIISQNNAQYYGLLVHEVHEDLVLVTPGDTSMEPLPGFEPRWIWSKFFAILDESVIPRPSNFFLPGLEPSGDF